jgi:hypothetical protein
MSGRKLASDRSLKGVRRGNADLHLHTLLRRQCGPAGTREGHTQLVPATAHTALGVERPERVEGGCPGTGLILTVRGGKPSPAQAASTTSVRQDRIRTVTLEPAQELGPDRSAICKLRLFLCGRAAPY